MADDLGGEPVAGVAGASGYCHPTRLLTLTRRRKCPTGHQVDGAAGGPLDAGGQAQASNPTWPVGTDHYARGDSSGSCLGRENMLSLRFSAHDLDRTF